MADTAIVCPTCQHSFDLPRGPSSGRVECPRCRAKLRISTRLKPPDEPLLIPLASAAGRNMAICRDCGTQVSREAKACPKCGRVFRKQSPWLTFVMVAIVMVPMVLIGGVFMTILGLVLFAGSRSSPPPTAVTPARTSIDPMPVVTPTEVTAIPLEKRRAIYQLYCNGRDIAFMAWFEAQPLNERLAWKSETPEVQSNSKDVWVSIHHHQICEAIAPFLAKANPPIHLTAGEISAIVQEGRSQHWPERP
jgi:ribosomal protein L40E